MIRVVHIAVLILLGGVLLAALGAFAGVGLSEMRLRQAHDARPALVEPVTGPEALERGRYLMEALLKCGACHMPDMGGGLVMDVPGLARIDAPNLTPGEGSATRAYAPADWERAIRQGIKPDGRSVLLMPVEQWAGLGDDDLAAVVAYLSTLPAVDRTPAPPRLRFGGRMLLALGRFPILSAEKVGDAAPPASAPGPNERGYAPYLARIAGCIGCHGEDLAGGRIPGTPPFVPPASDIRPDALAGWTDADFERALRECRRPDGTRISAFMPCQHTSLMSDEDVTALWQWLRAYRQPDFRM